MIIGNNTKIVYITLLVTGNILLTGCQASDLLRSDINDNDTKQIEVVKDALNTEEKVDNMSSEETIKETKHSGDNITTMQYSEDEIEKQFYISEIPDDVFEKMQGKSYKSDCTIERDELRYVHVLHIGFDGETHEGEIVCNKEIADDLIYIFSALYDAKYEIEKIRLIDEYDADDESSMADNNSSSFNYRFISHTTTVSKHGKGMAIDINPLYNPYVKTVNGKINIEPANAEDYVDRNTEFAHKIDKDDLCYKLFLERGFSWGGSWKSSKDYQHFEK